MSRIQINEVELFVETHGEGFPLVFLNPGAMDLRAWDDQMTDFGRHFHVHRYDYRCTGRSDRFEGAVSHMRDLDTLLNHLNIEKAFVVGASFGGSLAINVAVAHPDRVAALVVLGGGGPQNGFPLTPALVEKLTPIVLAAREDRPRAIEMWLSSPDLGLPRDNPRVSSLIREMALANGDYWTMDPRSLDPLDPPASQRLSEIVAPTLVLIGENDQSYLHETAEQLAAGIPGAIKKVLSDAGHLANMEQPEVFNRTVLDFLEPLRI